ncbi:DUF6603 domain-containing protein [Streptomyces sp. NBC_00568]|uniref:DUF6603 domain-containing protein n=1 Tax=Streptomyces sp. NBC_00568 TaxID=2975779 RepID=UPI002B1D5AE6|nr:DUF6603 domain-containing protein [Streptomyces sp. NBC_00568]
MTVDDLRALLAEAAPDGEVVVPGEALGPESGTFRPLFEDGVLRARREDGGAGGDGDGEGLSFAGSARTVLAEEPVPVRVAFGHNGAPEVTEVRLSAELPTPGTAADALGQRLGIEGPALPDMLRVTELTLEQTDGTLRLTGSGEHGRIAVVRRQGTGRLLVAESDAGWRVLCADSALDERQLADLASAADGVSVPRLAAGLPAGAWLLLPGPAGPDAPLLVPVRPERRDRTTGTATAPVRKEGPAAYTIARNGVRREPHAIATDRGFYVLAPGGLRATWGRFGVTGPSTYVPGRSWSDFGLTAGASVSVEYRNSPLTILGGLAALDASRYPDYEAVAGGVLVVDTGTFSGSAVAAAFVPAAGGKTSFFAFGALGSAKGIGLPAFQVRGIAAGMGWRSNLRLAGTEDLAEFPFLKALDDPASIGMDADGNADPIGVLEKLTSPPVGQPWVTPAAAGEDPLWLAAGLAFTVAEFFNGSAMAVLQTGEDLTLAMLGMAGMEFPKKANRKYASVEIALEIVLKPKAGELSFSAALTPNSYVIDPSCRLRGGVAAKIWFGPSPNRGDFVVTVGGYHRNYKQPDTYPSVPRLGFDWDLSGAVTISGSAYLALTPAAVMGGGSLDVRFHSGPVRAWLTAGVDVLIQWKPFWFEAGFHVSIGVSASVKILFVRITITVEVGASLTVWGPPTGGRAKIKLWFISFTIGFGRDREADSNALDWPGFREMLPPGDNAVRMLPGAGLIADRPPWVTGTRSSDDEAWQVSSAGFAFSTDSAVPVTELYVNTATGSPVERGSKLDIRPMAKTGLTSVQCVSLSKDGESFDISDWGHAPSRAAVPQALWGAGSSNMLPAPGEQVVPDELTGATLMSPGPDYGNDTGYITEQTFAFDPIDPDGIQPLDPDASRVGPVPRRPGGVIRTITDTVAASAQKTARSELAAALTSLGFSLGALDEDLSAHAQAAETAFTAEPMLVPAS